MNTDEPEKKMSDQHRTIEDAAAESSALLVKAAQARKASMAEFADHLVIVGKAATDSVADAFSGFNRSRDK